MNIHDCAPSQHRLVIKDALGEDTEGWVDLVGRYSTEFYNAARDGLRDKNIFDKSLEVLESENIRTLASCVIDWNEDFFTMPCTLENVESFIGDPKFHWLKESIEKAVMDKSLFFSNKSDDAESS